MWTRCGSHQWAGNNLAGAEPFKHLYVDSHLYVEHATHMRSVPFADAAKKNYLCTRDPAVQISRMRAKN